MAEHTLHPVYWEVIVNDKEVYTTNDLADAMRRIEGVTDPVRIRRIPAPIRTEEHTDGC